MPVSDDDFHAKLASSRRKLNQQGDTTVAVAPTSPVPPQTQHRARLHQIVRTPTGKTVDVQRMPPHANEAEEAVLSAMMQYPKQCVPEARHLLSRDHFYNPVNAELFTTMIAQFDAGRAEESRWLISFTQYLRDSGRLKSVGDAPYVTHLATIGIAESSLSFYAQMLREKFVLRELIACGTKLVRASYGAVDDEISSIMDDFGHWFERIRNDASSGLNGSELQSVAALHAFDPTHDPNRIAGRRWLVRGGTSLWAGGSGYGKSTLAMQFIIYWSCGRKCFNLGPSRPMRSLVVQAENDLGDMAEQFQGVYAGIAATQDINLEESKKLIEENVIIHRVVGKTGVAFLALLDSLIQSSRCDICWIDPLFAFAGCDLMHSEKTGRFLREGLFPIAVKRNVSMQVMHHIGKPVRGDSKDVAVMSDIDHQYLGFGTSEIQNAFRAVNILLPVAKSHVYKLVLSKRGERAGAKDIEGEWTQTLFLEHSKQGICWLQCEEPTRADTSVHKPEHVLEHMNVGIGYRATDLQKHIAAETGMSKATFYRIWPELKSEELITCDSDGQWFKK